MIRATLRSMDMIVRSEAEIVAYLQKDFGLEPKIAVDTYKILKRVVNSDGDIEDSVSNALGDNFLTVFVFLDIAYCGPSQ